MKLLQRLFLNFLPTGHRVRLLRDTPQASFLPEALVLGLFLLFTTYSWPIGGIAEAFIRLNATAGLSEFKYFILLKLTHDGLPLLILFGIWMLLARELNLQQKVRITVMNWFPAVLVRTVMEGIPLAAPKVAWLPVPVFPLPLWVTIAVALVHLGLLARSLKKTPEKTWNVPAWTGFSIVALQLAIAAGLFVIPLVRATPRFVLAPDFSVPAMDGTTCSLKDHRGKPVLLELWTYGCGHCRRQVPELEKVAEKMGDRLVILSLHVAGGVQAAGRMADLVAGKPFRVCLGEGSTVSEYRKLAPPHKPGGVPHIVLIDRNGIIRKSLSGFRESNLLLSEIHASGILR